ncbi:MAG: Sua5/YciO/YrdC/YwlC family protein [Mycoplasmataceae bacterium]|jgi:L-threonylcarbamoyladenylate synthase|nr:Sua5/YciO/YrdC/YwlC family protein [Mycoplasmataceae bacterium]
MRTYKWDNIEQITFEINNRKAIILPTDTVLGIISKVPELIYKIKKRPKHKKLVKFVDDIKNIANLNDKEKKVISKYWPGPLTIIKNNIGYRIPNHPQLLNLLKSIHWCYSSSTNLSGKNPINNIDQAKDTFIKNINNIVFVDEPQKEDKPSTIISLDNYQVLRNGIVDGLSIIKQLKD